MNLSVIVTALNEDHAELNATIASIRATAGDAVEVLVVDDQSSTPVTVEDSSTIVLHNRWRCGVGPSRHIGACHASGDWLLITDSHMRFAPGWFEAFCRGVHREKFVNMDAFTDDGKAIFCGSMIGLDWQNSDLSKSTERYHGATLNVYGPDRSVPNKMQVFEAVWLKPSEWPEDGGDIPVCMGASYFIAKNWFLRLAPTMQLKTWGQDEAMMSVKSWLAGGSVRILKSVEIGHKSWVSEAAFRKLKSEGRAKTVQPKKMWECAPGHVNFNKLFAIHTLAPDLADKLVELMGNAEDAGDLKIAKQLLRDDWRIVATEQANNRRLFVHDFRWFCDKFNIPLPH